MKFAVVDIGSNAIRFQISTVIEQSSEVLFKRLEYVRYPLRLGHDVFLHGSISRQSIVKFKKLMRVYKLLIELYEVDDYMFCATSAMRESKNGLHLVEQIKKELGISIQIISGDQEAHYVKQAIGSVISKKNYLHIDVGGGSTELNLFIDGNQVEACSFKIGSVRILENSDVPDVWRNLEKWTKEHTHGLKSLTAIGTGGNISKMLEIANRKPGQALSLKKAKAIHKMLSKTSMDDRIYRLIMNPDRADVILPAGKIYISVMEWAGTDEIIVPDVGLKDGMLHHLFAKHKAKK